MHEEKIQNMPREPKPWFKSRTCLLHVSSCLFRLICKFPERELTYYPYIEEGSGAKQWEVCLSSNTDGPIRVNRLKHDESKTFSGVHFDEVQKSDIFCQCASCQPIRMLTGSCCEVRWQESWEKAIIRIRIEDKKIFYLKKDQIMAEVWRILFKKCQGKGGLGLPVGMSALACLPTSAGLPHPHRPLLPT